MRFRLEILQEDHVALLCISHGIVYCWLPVISESNGNKTSKTCNEWAQIINSSMINFRSITGSLANAERLKGQKILQAPDIFLHCPSSPKQSQNTLRVQEFSFDLKSLKSYIFL